MFPPERIVCLSEETVETLYVLGEQDRIVGISTYCVRPPEARREKPRVRSDRAVAVAGEVADRVLGRGQNVSGSAPARSPGACAHHLRGPPHRRNRSRLL